MEMVKRVKLRNFEVRNLGGEIILEPLVAHRLLDRDGNRGSRYHV